MPSLNVANRTLFTYDNLPVMQGINSECIDLIYLDPPFNSNRNYAAPLGSHAAGAAFTDTWTLDDIKKEWVEDIEADNKATWASIVSAGHISGESTQAYLTYMAIRLIEMRRILKDTGSIYLHCDPTASHYLKLLMDSVFGAKNFRSEIIWCRTGSHNSIRNYGSIHDTILFYSASNKYKFSINKRPYTREHIEKRYTIDDTGRLKQITGGNIMTGAGVSSGESGQSWRGFDPSAKNRHWAIPAFLKKQLPTSLVNAGVLKKLDALYDMGLIEVKQGAAWPHPVRFLEESDGLSYQDIWAYQPYTEGILYGTDEGIDADVKWLGPTTPERLGYPTQKPLGLLNRIIKSSSNPNDMVLDPFCGCATALVAAEQLGRHWIGIDVEPKARDLVIQRLEPIRKLIFSC